ncbi:MAG: phage portal protein [Oscillospiraceae bacterium]|nr:phage portal protein [Oscillospiraceae bacterium]
MRLFKKRETGIAAEAVQIRPRDAHPFGVFAGYVPLRGGEAELYRAVREAVPVVDAAITKIIRLTGGVSAECPDKAAERGLNEFLRTVSTGRGQRGIESFLSCYLESMLTYGRAAGEIVLGGGDIAAVLCGDVSNIEIREGSTPLDFELCSWTEKGSIEPLPYQDLLLFTPFNPEPENPYGVSLLRSMPFLTDILLKIYNSIGLNWERAGNVRFAVIYKPQGELEGLSGAKERSRQIAKEWAAAMQSGKNGSVRDFVAVGDVDIKVIGADNQVLDSETPVRQIIEQLVARTGIPPFMLGLSWSSTERMSAQQADILTSEITAIRRSLEPALERICSLWLRLHGWGGSVRAVWEDINLQDETEEAKAELYRAQAEKIKHDLEKEGEN